MLFYDNPYYTIRYDASLSLVEIIWHGFVTSEQLQGGLLHVLAVVRAKRATFLLANSVRLNALKASDQTWIKNNFFPAVPACGITKIARITNSDIFTQAIVSKLTKLVQEEDQFSFELQSFYDRDDALEWMFSDQALSANTL